MAREFIQANDEYLQINSAAVTAAPFSVGFWWYSYDTSLSTYMASISNRDNISNFWFFYRYVPDADVRFAVKSSVGAADAVTTADISQDTWHHVLGVAAATNDRRIYLDGGNKGTETTDLTPSGINTMAIGTRIISTQPTGDRHVEGRMAEFAIWNVALSDEDAVTLAARFSPLFVKPQNLVAYWPLIRDEDQDRIGGYDMTAYNTPTIAAHSPIIYPAPPPIGLG